MQVDPLEEFFAGLEIQVEYGNRNHHHLVVLHWGPNRLEIETGNSGLDNTQYGGPEYILADVAYKAYEMHNPHGADVAELYVSPTELREQLEAFLGEGKTAEMKQIWASNQN